MALAAVIVNLPVTVLGIGSHSGEEGIITLINQLNKTNIWYLELVFNNFTPGSMEALANTLPSTQLSYLELDYNNLNDRIDSPSWLKELLLLLFWIRLLWLVRI